MLPYHERNLRHKPPTEPAAMRQAFATVNGLAPGQDAAQRHVLPTRMDNFAMEDNNIRQTYAAQHSNHRVPRLLGAYFTKMQARSILSPASKTHSQPVRRSIAVLVFRSALSLI